MSIIKSFRKFIIPILLVYLLSILPINIVFAAEENLIFSENLQTEEEITGNIYKNQKITADNLAVKCKIKSLKTNKSGELVLNVLLNQNRAYNLTFKGKLYNPDIIFYNGNKLIALLNETSEVKPLSFSIENNAKEEMLLASKRHLKGKMIVRLALLLKETNDIIYVEDLIKLKTSFEKLKSCALKVVPNDAETYEKVHMAETWFVPYLNDSNNPSVSTIFESTKNTNIFPKSKEDSLISKTILLLEGLLFEKAYAADTLPYGVQRSVFTSTDQKYEISDYNGYYKESYEWPVGTGNIITYFIRADINVGCLKDECTNNHWISVQLKDNDTYLYIKSSNQVVLFDTFCPLKLANCKSAIYIKDPKQDFIINRTISWHVDNSSTVSSLLKWGVSKIPYINSLSNFTDSLIESVCEVKSDGYIVKTFGSTIEEQIREDGKVVRAVTFTSDDFWMQNDEASITPYITLFATVKDGDPGKLTTKTMYYYVAFKIWKRNGFGFYTENVWSPSRTISKSYTR